MDPVVDDLERQRVAEVVVSNHAAPVAAECRELVLAAQWADLHPVEALGSGVGPPIAPSHHPTARARARSVTLRALVRVRRGQTSNWPASRRALTSERKRAASAPSTRRWS